MSIIDRNPRREVEICCGDIESVAEAKAGGASRIELCCGLTEGGITPSVAMIRYAAESGIRYINVLIRPRSGDFLYTEDEVRLMENEITDAVNAGATGIVIGALTPEGDIDMQVNRRLIDAARRDPGKRIHITFHRAFDVSRDPKESLKRIISLGCGSLLTSGMAPDAETGIPMLRELVKQAGGRIQIMAGSGVTPSNARAILASGVGAIHATARSLRESRMRFHRDDVPMGAPGSDEYSRRVTDRGIVAQLISIAGSAETKTF